MENGTNQTYAATRVEPMYLTAEDREEFLLRFGIFLREFYLNRTKVSGMGVHHGFESFKATAEILLGVNKDQSPL